MNREAIFKALEKKLEAVPGVRTFGRRLLHWADVPPSDQPALFMTGGSQSVTVEGRGMPPKRSLPVSLYLYNRNDDPGQQNDLLDAIEAALEPDRKAGEDTLTLGGLVSHCRIEGEIETDEGLLGEQAVAIVPVSVLVP